MSRLPVAKTYKLFIGGAFPRSESGRVYDVATPTGEFIANASKASRKDARDAVVAARAAVAKWSGATAYNRGQVLYRIAEMLEGRPAQFTEGRVGGSSRGDRPAGLVRGVDRQVRPSGRWREPRCRTVLQPFRARTDRCGCGRCAPVGTNITTGTGRNRGTGTCHGKHRRGYRERVVTLCGDVVRRSCCDE